MTREADIHPLLAARATVAPVPATKGPPPPPGTGLGIDELAQLLQMLRSAEAERSDRKGDVVVGAFTIEGWRVPPGVVEPLLQLTRSEAAVVRFLGWGRSNADIATLLNVNENTVRTHMTNAIRKLDTDGTRGLNSLAGLLFHPID